MLVKCNECDLPVSDKALFCPHCGNPFSANVVQTSKQKNKRKRLPNGFGQISEIKSQNLRKPFRAMVTVGKDKNGKPMQKLLKPESFFSTYNDAYTALLEYNKNPYDLSPEITVKQLYEKWSAEYFKTLKSDSSVRTIVSAWSYCSSVYDMRAMDIRARHIKGCIDDGIAIIKGKEQHATVCIKERIKSLFNLMLDYAVEYEITERNYARTFKLSDDVLKIKEEEKRCHISFSDGEMQLLWNNVCTKKYIDVVLIQCYSGWRPQELGLIELENVNLVNWTYVGGMKTAAGTNRTVPIHSKIRDLVKKRYDEAKRLDSKYLINCTDSQTHMGSNLFSYDKYRVRFAKIRDELGLNPLHRAHDGRMQFITMAKKYGVDEYAIKYIVGHTISDITEKVYTDREISWLSSEMEKIK